MPPKSYKTTETDFEVFKNSVLKYLYFFGLKSWEVSFSHNDKNPNNRATCEYELGAMHVNFVLTKSRWGYQPTNMELRLLGFHETCELLLADITHWAEARRPEGDLQDITHNLIHVLENSVFSMIEDNPKT